MCDDHAENAMLCFLLGRKMFDGATIDSNDLNRAMNVMGLASSAAAAATERRTSGLAQEVDAGTKRSTHCTRSGTEPEPEPCAVTGPKARWIVGLLERYAETVALFAAAAPEHFVHPEVM